MQRLDDCGTFVCCQSTSQALLLTTVQTMALSLEQQLILYMFHELQKNKILPLIYRANSQPPVYLGCFELIGLISPFEGA